MYILIVDDIPGTQYNEPFIWSFSLSCLLEFIEKYKIEDWQICKRCYRGMYQEETIDIIIGSSIKSKQKLNAYWSKKNERLQRGL